MNCLSCEQVMERIEKSEADCRALSLENTLLKHDLEQMRAKYESRRDCYGAELAPISESDGALYSLRSQLVKPEGEKHG